MAVSTMTASHTESTEITSSSSISFSLDATQVILASTTASQPTAASTSPAVSEDSASSDKGRHAPFYVAVILGSIVAIGFIAAVIAWLVRLRMHARRRRENLIVPWAKHPNDDRLEEGRDAAYTGQPVNVISSMNISSQDADPWEPRGDRDVGEPKRSSSYVRGSVHPRQNSDADVDHRSHPVPREDMAFPLPIYHAYATRNPSADVDAGSLDGHQSISTLGPLQVANMAPGDTSAASSPSSTALAMNNTHPGSCEDEYGTPQPNLAGSRPPFLALHGEGLRVPWGSKTEPSSAERRAGGPGHWERLPALDDTRSATGVAADDDSWTSSPRSNLTYAFNAVAANLPDGSALMRNRAGVPEGDRNILTPKHSQHSSSGSTRSSLSDVNIGEELLSRNDSHNSRLWTLEEREDGTGRVHFHGHGLDALGYGTPQMINSSATLEAPTSAGTSVHRMSTQGSNTPLVSQPPRSAFLRPETCYREAQRGREGQNQPSMRSISSCTSSVYSMASGVSNATSSQPASAPGISTSSRHNTIKNDHPKAVRERTEEAEARPGKLVARSSSSGCSFSSYYFGADAAFEKGGDITEVREPINHSLSRRTQSRTVA
ncbi:hypothetical protein LshimejAT787_1700260 [Lyophyllum shimeji]|uniref:Uncharacterized protein n=1 Tax=Lyophyllum shimeji TaxID=47721 RepID=A0A9P3PZK8_LYOSH|nr:hypothetical protein LshimejAT787_1700260 [Lyophyllum shimeji]